MSKFVTELEENCTVCRDSEKLEGRRIRRNMVFKYVFDNYSIPLIEVSMVRWVLMAPPPRQEGVLTEGHCMLASRGTHVPVVTYSPSLCPYTHTCSKGSSNRWLPLHSSTPLQSTLIKDRSSLCMDFQCSSSILSSPLHLLPPLEAT